MMLEDERPMKQNKAISIRLDDMLRVVTQKKCRRSLTLFAAVISSIVLAMGFVTGVAMRCPLSSFP